MLALSDPVAITVTVGAVLILLVLIATLRTFLRREPSPPRWLRYRAGIFVERDPRAEWPQLHDEAPTKVNWPPKPP